MDKITGQRITLLGFLIFTIWLGFYIIKPPAPKPSTVDAIEFSADRAFKHVQQIAKSPHPLGSAANDSARMYIVEKLREFGLEPEIQEGVGTGSYKRGIFGYTKNIFTKINGRDSNKTILLMSHYDSVPNAPGAADDASGTAAILETVRAIQSRETPLKNNVWVLITDGEERGLLGAEFFVDEFDELNEIDLVLNFEARGTSGPSMMFETSSPNNRLISHFAKATPHPVANSLMYTVYKILPNDTDLSVIKRAGMKGLNFAFTDDFLNYHTMQDKPENLSMASLQHHGTNMLGNVLYFGDRDFNLESSSEYVYFNDMTGGLFYYPSSWSFPLVLFTALLFLTYLIFLFRTGRLGLGTYLGSILLYLGMVVAGALITYFGWQFIKIIHPQYQWLNHQETYNHIWYLWGFILLITALFSGIYGLDWIRKNLPIESLLTGPFTFWILLALGSSWYLPSAAFVFTWPVLIALIGWIALGEDIIESSWKTTFISAISVSVLLFMISPYIYLIQVLLTSEMLAVGMVVLVQMLGLIWPMIWQIIRPQKIIFTSGLALVALTCFLFAAANSGYDDGHKKQNDMNYAQNLETGQAYWISRDHTTDPWTQQFLGTDYQAGNPENIRMFRSSEVLYNKAKADSITSPLIEVLADSSAGSLRYLSLRIIPQRDGIGMQMRWENCSINGMILDGLKITKSTAGNEIIYFKDLSNPIKLYLPLESNENASLYFTFFRMGLPTDLISDYQKREPDMMPKTGWFSNTSFWQITVNPDTLKGQKFTH